MGFITGGTPGNQPPVASFTSSCVAATHTCTLDGSGSTDDVGVVSRVWKRGNGTQLGTGPTLIQAFSKAGSFPISLTVTDAGGLTNTLSQNVVVP